MKEGGIRREKEQEREERFTEKNEKENQHPRKRLKKERKRKTTTNGRVVEAWRKGAGAELRTSRPEGESFTSLKWANGRPSPSPSPPLSLRHSPRSTCWRAALEPRPGMPPAPSCFPAHNSSGKGRALIEPIIISASLSVSVFIYRSGYMAVCLPL